MARKKKEKKILDTYDFKTFQKELKRQLTNNVTVNIVLSPIYFLICLYILYFEYHIPLYQSFYKSSLIYSFGSTLIYIYASHFYQPDLDVYMNRPGMGHFPLGKTISNFRLGRFFKWLLYPVNRIWYHLWTPYARIFTHRGVSHYPFISTMLRALYLYFWYIIIAKIFGFLGIPLGKLTYIEYWLKNFFIKNDFFYFILLNFPIYISDIAHFTVDYWDSVKRGVSFCPPKIQKGLMYQIYLLLKGGNDL